MPIGKVSHQSAIKSNCAKVGTTNSVSSGGAYYKPSGGHGTYGPYSSSTNQATYSY